VRAGIGVFSAYCSEGGNIPPILVLHQLPVRFNRRGYMSSKNLALDLIAWHHRVVSTLSKSYLAYQTVFNTDVDTNVITILLALLRAMPRHTE
jgi:hypothetical protein